MADRPDYTKPIAFALQEIPATGRRDWAAQEAEIKSVVVIETAGLAPEETGTYTIYTIPAGKVDYWTDLIESFTTRCHSRVYLEGVMDLFRGAKEAESHINIALTTPLVFTAGMSFKFDIENVDIVDAFFSTIWIFWETAASKPAVPRFDEPEERYKTGDFNYCTKYYLPDNEMVMLFNKIKEDKRNYLKYKDHGKPTEKKLASMHLNNKEAQEIMNTIHSEPKNVKSILKKYEGKYSKIKIR